jgi:hypothetical protein
VFPGPSVATAPWHSGRCSALETSVAGRVGNPVATGEAKSNAPVRSPTMERRHAVSLGSSSPDTPLAANSVVRKRIIEVWSLTSEHTMGRHPADPGATGLRDHGEITSMGTRGPSPTGPAMPPSPPDGGTAVRYSPGVPAGATGGGTWSKKPPLSSQVRNTAVFAQSSGLELIAERICATASSPQPIGVGGCSVNRNGELIHDTAGSVPAAQSVRNSAGEVCEPSPFWARAGLV